MQNSLYVCHQHWFHGGQVYFYSDPHFGDDEMKYLRKNYIGDEEQVKSINRVIGKNDTIIFLGDIGDIEYIKKIRGYKVLILGNHDKGKSNYERQNAHQPEDNHLFDEVYTGSLIISDKIILSHEPVDFHYAFNIHGHEHTMVNRDNHLNVCAEHIKYKPVCFKSILDSGMLKNIPDVHRECIDRASGKKSQQRL